ncbi:flagellar motor stator protein MotA [Candidatus Tenderia electrophaga]|jgi:chemotaxis protein MotA|uniref:Flagellar motor stator protein MotA n=1 Tax=Candidatus Tenderia electrophaga TaxID=1748243 RepID=A0A0S2TH61_9GAMM|nr:flagellar motor stator protein MotA [Candidatus Tenderia electrophaga]
MLIIIGFVVVLACVAGGFVLSHGNLLSLWQPFELLIIGGAAFGAFLASNPAKVHKAVLKNLLGALKGSKYKKALYLDLLSLMYDLLQKSRKEGMMAIEADIEAPSESALFSKHPSILADHHVVEFICDYLRLMVGGNMNPFELENLMDIELAAHHKEAAMPAEAITKVADALPGFGIVAAVLGIVITMSYIGGDPATIGSHVAAALVGTFLGILLAYGFVAPLAVAMEHNAREEAKFYECIKICLMAAVNGYNPQVAVEFGRKVMYASDRPSFIELEEHVKNSQ